MLKISNKIAIPFSEIEISAVLSGGPGGQHVNKVSSAIHLRFDIKASSLPDIYKQRLLKLKDRRITKDGVIIIKAQQSRSQVQNKEIALTRLQELIGSVFKKQKRRIPTKPTAASRERRLQNKTKKSQIKQTRRKVDDD